MPGNLFDRHAACHADCDSDRWIHLYGLGRRLRELWYEFAVHRVREPEPKCQREFCAGRGRQRANVCQSGSPAPCSTYIPGDVQSTRGTTVGSVQVVTQG